MPAAYPSVNWDMVAYVAAALDNGAQSAAELHKVAWEAVRERVSDGEFLVLTADRPYRVRQYADAQAFATMLGFYEAKFLYVEVASCLSRWMQPVDGLQLISVVSAAALGAVIAFWALKEKFLAQAPFILALLVFSGFSHTAFLVVPDPFASVFLVLAAWLYLRSLDLACAVMLVLAQGPTILLSSVYSRWLRWRRDRAMWLPSRRW